MTKPAISVILSTYNQPAWLEKVLAGYDAQTFTDFEIVIADDGSGQETRQIIDAARQRSERPIHHVWHEDDGFRKSDILNAATVRSEGAYLLFSDGDCVPRSDFIAQHAAAACPGRFLSGGYIKLPMHASQTMSIDDILSGRAFTVAWLRQQGCPLSRQWLRMVAGKYSAPLLNRLTTTRATWNGNNSSGFREDVVRAGGFDQRMRYGGQDRELGERLENAGIRGKHIRYQTVCLHLDHARGYANAEDRQRNLQIRKETVQSGRAFTEFGIPSRVAA